MSLANNQISTAFLALPATPPPQASGVIAGVRASEAGQAPTTGSAPGVGVASCVIAAAGAAIVASRKTRTRTSNRIERCAFENELGVQAPIGFWDPVGYSSDGNAENFTRRRSVEIKHGRISMLATMGYITPELVGKFPGYLSPSAGIKFDDVPNGLAAFSKVPTAGWIQMFLYAFYCEASANYDQDVDNGTPGDMGWKPPLLSGGTPEQRTRRLNAEIANGRLAMMAIIGMFFQDGLTGSAWGDWAVYTDSPLRAFESELGVQAPVGFWDPLGLSKDGDMQSFLRRRSVEIKHGRVCMLATMGYITPDLVGKFPGTLSPSMGIKFADIPNGLAALGKVPPPGWTQIFAYAFYCELSAGYDNDVKNGTPGDMGWKPPFLSGGTPETRARRLNAEIANGRLAMMAIIGMFFQDGLTGSAWGDWANYTDSPLRAFETELGVQSPVGFWDPVGFTADGDISAFRRRRSVELKHGRICMLACMGYLTPEIIGKWPGNLSFSSSLKFSDVPNGIGAISKVPLLGWAQIVAYFGAVEYSGGFEDYKTGTPGDYGWKLITSNDPEKLTRKLQSEIANGRLAMIAIMGMLFQNGVVGDTGPLMWAGKPAGALRRESTALRAIPKALESTGGPFPDDVWDPARLMNGKSEEQVLHWRAVELKHGRTCMLACLGWFHVAAGWHPIGDAAARVRVSDDPLVNVSQLSMAGAWQVVFTIMCFEWLTAYICKPAADRPWDIFGWQSIIADEEEPQWKNLQLQEINNGRLAMFAILGLIAQDAATGDYVAGIGQICFGMCSPEAWLGQVFPDTPFVMGPLYPMGPRM